MAPAGSTGRMRGGGGALEEVIGHDFEAGGDDAADVVAAGERMSKVTRAEIDDDGGAP